MLSSGLVSGQNLSAASLLLCPLPDRKQSQQFETLWGLIPGSLNGFLKPDLMWKRTWTCPPDVVQVSRREWDCPLPCRSPAMFAQFCEVMVVHLLSSASPKTTQVAHLGEWAIVGAIFSVFCPGDWGTFCYSGDIYVKIAWQSVFSKCFLKKSSGLQTSMCFEVLNYSPSQHLRYLARCIHECIFSFDSICCWEH